MIQFQRNRWMNFSSAVLLSFVIMVILTMTVMRPVYCISSPKNLTLTIIATGQRSKQSQGTAVRIASISVDGSKSISLQKIPLSGEWVYQESMLESIDNREPSVLTVKIPSAQNVDVEFIKQGGSGIVRLKADSQGENMDLYSSSKDWERTKWHYKDPGEFKPFARIDLLFGMWLVTFIIIEGFIYWKKNKE